MSTNDNKDGPYLFHVAFRVSAQQLSRLERKVEQTQARLKGHSVTVADVMRALIEDMEFDDG